MPRPKGHPKSGGRKVGSLNKRTEDLLQLMEESGYNPLKSLLAKYNSLSPEDQLKIDLKLMEYVYPKLKEQNLIVESGNDKDPQEVENQFKMVMELIHSPNPETKEIFCGIDPQKFFDVLTALSAEGIFS